MYAVASMCTAPWQPKPQPYMSMANGLVRYPSCKDTYVQLILLRESSKQSKLPSVSTNVRGGGTIQGPTLLRWGSVSAGICQPVVFNCSHHLHRIPGGGDGIVFGLGCCHDAFHRDRRIAALHAWAVPNLMPLLMAIETRWLTFPVTLILVTLITFIALPTCTYSIVIAFGISFREQ